MGMSSTIHHVIGQKDPALSKWYLRKDQTIIVKNVTLLGLYSKDPFMFCFVNEQTVQSGRWALE